VSSGLTVVGAETHREAARSVRDQRARRSDESITPLHEAMAIYSEAGNRNGEGMVLDNLGIGLRELGRD
jgi:hypothetical protein